MELLFGKKDASGVALHHSSSPGSSSGSPGQHDAPGGKRRRNKPNSKKVAPGTPQTPPSKRSPIPLAATLSVLVTRTDLFDDYGGGQRKYSYNSEEDNNNNSNMMVVVEDASSPRVGYPARPAVAEYHYVEDHDPNHTNTDAAEAVAIVRVPSSQPACSTTASPGGGAGVVVAPQQPPPQLDPSIQKYWKQRRRLFSRFDQGIQLDQEGWFSVTPEPIALHVAARTVDLVLEQQRARGCPAAAAAGRMTVLDAFGGCGGNALAFAQNPAVQQVICVDIDRTKLRCAANNAAIYQIPPGKIIFVECNVIFLLEYCYKHGAFQLDQPLATMEAAMKLQAAMPPPVPTEVVQGYQIGGIDTLPRRIDVVFMDPPWGGVDYEVFGKGGYCLERNMLIPRPAYQQQAAHEGVGDAFFDTFAASQPRNKQERKAAFNLGLDATNCVNGAELLALAAQAAAVTVYDIPRNTSRLSLGQAALKAGYRGNCKLEEHYLNGRLKTVTAYFGKDWRSELLPDETDGGGGGGED